MDVRALACTAPVVAAPVNSAVCSIVDSVMHHATTLASVPGAIAPAMLQALSDIGTLVQLGTPSASMPAEVKRVQRRMADDAHARAVTTTSSEQRVGILSQAMLDINIATHLCAPDADQQAVDHVVTRLLTLSNVQRLAQNRADVLDNGVKVLSGLLTARPKVLQPARPHSMPVSTYLRTFLMSRRRRHAFNELWERLHNLDVTLPRGTESERFSMADALAHLLSAGALDKRDTNRNDLLFNLHEMLTAPLASSLNRHELLTAAVVHVAWPAKSMSQGTHRACAAAAVTYQLATRRPSEYARLLLGFCSPQGTVRLAGGGLAARVADSLEEDGSGRSPAERILQSALMEVGGTHFRSGSFHNLADGYFDDALQLTQKGMFAEEAAHLLEAIDEGLFETVHQPSAAALVGAAGRDAPCTPVILHMTGENHFVLLTAIDGGRVYFRNPRGLRTNQASTVVGADHRVHADGIESLPFHEFVQRARTLLRYVA